MDRLAWNTAKAQLYLLEAAYVKDAVGRDRIHRNKDALRELRCLQEILGDLHAGEFGRAPERRRKAAEAATRYWSSLCSAVAKHDSRGTPEEHCEVPLSVKRFLLALPDAASSGGPFRAHEGGSEAATSTRAPSEAADGRSTAAESHLSDAAWLSEGVASMALRPGGGQRLNRNQLDELAAELREQLDQEYTSLLSSIEEVQGLMEAEVAGVELLPPLEVLEAFALAAEAALRDLEQRAKERKELKVDVFKQAAKSKKLECSVVQLEPCSPCSPSPPCSPASCGSTDHQQKLLSPEVESALLEERLSGELAIAPRNLVQDAPSDLQIDASNASEALDMCEDPAAAASPGMAATSDAHRWDGNRVSVNGRPRWADLSDDEEAVAPMPYPERRVPPQLRPPPMQPAVLLDDNAAPGNAGQGPARARCGGCRELLGKDSFSRKAWRQARGLGGTRMLGAAEGEGALCRTCAPSV